MILIDGKAKYQREHRVIMERLIGRKLSREEEIHHVDGNSLNNNIENLLLIKRSEHAKLHGLLWKGTKRPVIQKYEILKTLPDPRFKNEVVSLLPEYRTYKTNQCLSCNTLFWHRKDYTAKYCSQKCGLLSSWSNGKYNNRKPKKCLNIN